MYSPAAVVEDADCSRRQRLATSSGLLSRMRPRNIFLNVHPQPFSCTLWENQKHSGSVNSHRANSMFATFSANCLPKPCICSFSTYVKTFFRKLDYFSHLCFSITLFQCHTNPKAAHLIYNIYCCFHPVAVYGNWTYKLMSDSLFNSSVGMHI